MKQRMFLVHSIPGRARFLLEPLTGDAPGLHSLAAKVRTIAGVAEVRTNPLTASLVVRFDHALSLEALLAGIVGLHPAVAGWGSLSPVDLRRSSAYRLSSSAPRTRVHLVTEAVGVLRAADEAISEWLPLPVRARVAGPAALAVLGYFAWLRGRSFAISRQAGLLMAGVGLGHVAVGTATLAFAAYCARRIAKKRKELRATVDILTSHETAFVDSVERLAKVGTLSPPDPARQ